VSAGHFSKGQKPAPEGISWIYSGEARAGDRHRQPVTPLPTPRPPRGTAEQHIKEDKFAFPCTRLSCRQFGCNEVRLQRHALTDNLATFLRYTELPEARSDWPLTKLQLKLIKIRARVVRYARAIPFQLAEVAVTGLMVRTILAAIC